MKFQRYAVNLNGMQRGLYGVLAVLLIVLSLPAPVQAETLSPVQAGEEIRSALFTSQMALMADDTTAARNAFDQAQQAYQQVLSGPLGHDQAEIDQHIQQSFGILEQALETNDTVRFAATRADIWTALLAGSYAMTVDTLQQGDAKTAQSWLALREFRQATRFSRPNTDATVALDKVLKKELSASDALTTVHADLLDTYQGRLTVVLQDIQAAHEKGFAVQQAEMVALAQGYFALLAPAYQEQRGEQARLSLEQAFISLRDAALNDGPIAPLLTALNEDLKNFRAAPLSALERNRRVDQLFRFVNLIAVEYERGVSNGVVLRDFEIREATTFHEGATAAFNDLRDLLSARNASVTDQVVALLQSLDQQLQQAATQQQVTDPATIRTETEQVTTLLNEIIPEDWKQRSGSGDFDVIATLLDQMQSAVAEGDYQVAESARVEAYAVLESGPEARLQAFAPQAVKPIEDLFWNGQGEHQGLAYLISQKASLQEIKATRRALDTELAKAEEAIRGNSTPFSVITNAAIIVFREGLEAVLILASLIGSMKRPETRKYQRPLWIGSAVALLATVLTWLLMQGILSSLAQYGEYLEAIVSVIAIAVLLLITNWFFHKVYWTGWMARFHSQKRRLLGAEMGQWLGLALLGFSSIYREGFETVLFLQALVLESGVPIVLIGVGIGLLGTLAVGMIIFLLQMKLPYKRMLVVTGVMIGAVLLIMMGNTIQVFQVVGWLPIHVIPGIQLPYWAGMWFGLYMTWEGILGQFLAGAFVIGSYFLAEHQQKRRSVSSTATQTKGRAQPRNEATEATPEKAKDSVRPEHSKT